MKAIGDWDKVSGRLGGRSVGRSEMRFSARDCMLYVEVL